MNQIIADSNATMQAEAERAPFKTVKPGMMLMLQKPI